MNVKNKPVIQMDDKSQAIYNLVRENELLKMENIFLREQLQRAANGLSIEMPPDALGRGGGKKMLPPLSSTNRQASAGRRLDSSGAQMDIPYNKVISEFENEIARLKAENENIRNTKEVAEKNYQIVMNDNNALNVKLENLENIFIGNPIQRGDNKNQQRLLSDEYMAANLMTENTDLKTQITQLEEKLLEQQVLLRERENGMNMISKNIGDTMSQVNDLIRMKQANTELQKRVEYLQKRERDLLDTMVKNNKK